MTFINKKQITDLEMNADAHVSHFGALKSAATIPVLKGNFPGSGLDTVQWNKVIDNGGSITVGSGVASLNTGTNSAGSIKLISKQKGVFEAGQVTVYQTGTFAGVGVVNNIRRWGLMSRDEQDGLFFELNGTTFRVVARKAGVDTAVASTSFNGDTSFTPGASNNTYRIHYSAGRALFQRARSGKIVTLHTMVDSDYPLVDNLSLGLYYENTNSGNTTNVELRVRGASSSVFGQLQRFNRGGGLLTSDFTTEVALKHVSEYSIDTKFGRNPDTDTTSTPEDLWAGAEDLWAGAGDYTGFNATGNENISVASSDVNDTGSTLSTGTATGGSSTTLEDSGADFVSDGVTAGDLVINDTQSIHGIVTSVATTALTVFRMTGSDVATVEHNNASDAYRVVNANSTGAAVVRLSNLLNSSYEEQSPRYVVLNGTSTVTVTGNYMRCSRAQVILSGSSNGNEGTITVRQAVTTANIFASMPAGFNQTVIGAYTVPAGKTFIGKRLRISITRANGSAGSATISFNVRRFGEVFRSVRVFELQTGAPVEFIHLGGVIEPPGTDIKYIIEDVSDNNTVTDGAFEYLLIDE